MKKGDYASALMHKTDLSAQWLHEKLGSATGRGHAAEAAFAEDAHSGRIHLAHGAAAHWAAPSRWHSANPLIRGKWLCSTTTARRAERYAMVAASPTMKYGKEHQSIASTAARNCRR